MTAILQLPQMRVFFWLWLGQSVSSFGSGLSAFAVGVWLFQKTGTATPLTLAVLFGNTPGILLSPLAGLIVDRYNRKIVILLSNIGQALTTLALLLVVISGNIDLWKIYLFLALANAFSTFQWPAEQATVSLLVPSEHLGRANGLQSLGEGAATLVAPIAAGLLVPTIGISGTIIIDMLTFVFGALVLSALSIPNPEKSPERPELKKYSVREEVFLGWKFIKNHSGLLNMLLIGAAVNLTGFFVTFRLVTPLVLSRTSDTAILGWIGSAFGLGMISGGSLMSIWGGPRRKILGVFGSILVSGLFGQLLFGLGSITFVWMVAVFIGSFVIPIWGGCANAIWQSKTPKELQGRVFALRRLISQFTAPIGLLLIGPLADAVLQPFWKAHGPNLLGGWPGSLPGGGYAMAFVILGLFTALIAFGCVFIPSVRSIDDELPDV